MATLPGNQATKASNRRAYHDDLGLDSHMLRAAIGFCVLLLCQCATTNRATTTSTPSEQSNSDNIITRLRALEAQSASEKRTISELLSRLDALQNQLQRLETQAQDQLARGQQHRAKRDRRDQQRERDRLAVYAIPIDDDPYEGRRYAKVTMVAALEFACPYCERVIPTLTALKRAYGRDLKIVYKQYVVHPSAKLASLASCAAHLQNRYFAMQKQLWKNGIRANLDLTTKGAVRLARASRLNIRRFKRDLKGQTCTATLAKHQNQLRPVGVRGVPTFFINGRKIMGAMPEGAFRKVIDEELAKATAAIKSGVPLKTYYDTILATGKRTIAKD